VKRSVLIAVILAALASAGSAGALIEPGNIAAPTTNPYPTQPGVMVNGTLFPDTDPRCAGHCLDYLKFTVVSAGETIEFTDQNTTTGLNPNSCYKYCPVYLSVVDSNFKDPGGVSTGTFAIYGDTEVFDWTSQVPGTYYMVMEGEGDVTLDYAVSYKIVSGGGTTGPGGPNQGGPTAPLVRTLRVSPKQTGTKVNAYLTLGQWAQSVRVALRYGKHLKTITSLKRSPLGPGRHHFKFALPAAYQRKLTAQHKLYLIVRITVTGTSGATKTFNRTVTLTP
jgi:hypothetical protein